MSDTISFSSRPLLYTSKIDQTPISTRYGLAITAFAAWRFAIIGVARIFAAGVHSIVASNNDDLYQSSYKLSPLNEQPTPSPAQ